MDKAGKKYWNDSWAASDLPEAVDPCDMRLRNYTNRQFHQLFLKLFDKSETPSMRLLEIGCAKSAWLPYFAKEFGFSVGGLDYSPIGCQMAEKVLQANGVDAEVVCADLFSPPESMIGRFDVVVSFGVVEHFNDTTECIRAVSAFLKPGGVLITNIPNMVGWIGWVQKMVNKPVYDIHQLIDPTMMRASNKMAGLEVIDSDYFIFTGFGVNNLAGIATGSATWYLKKIFLGVLARTSMLVWFMEEKLGNFTPRKSTSPYVNCIARKP